MVLDDIGFDEDSVVRDDVAQTITVGIHFVLLGLLTLAAARPLLFPSLGPSAYLLAAGEGEDEASSAPSHVIGGHVIAVLAGLVSYHALASGLVIDEALSASAAAFSEPVLRLAGASIVAMMLTTISMLVTDTNHPAACATALIVALGLLSSAVKAAYIVLAVIVLVVAHERAIYPAMVAIGLEPKEPREA